MFQWSRQDSNQLAVELQKHSPDELVRCVLSHIWHTSSLTLWDSIRRAVLMCPDLPEPTRSEIIRLGDGQEW